MFQFLDNKGEMRNFQCGFFSKMSGDLKMRLSLSFLKAALPQANFLIKFPTKTHALDDSIAWSNRDVEVAVAFDSRCIQRDGFFVALKGSSFDGHSFIADVLEQGACGILISDIDALKNVPTGWWQGQIVVIVEDTYKALIDLARSWRQQLTIPVVAITGSVGKTTTKEMMRSILEVAGIHAQVSLKNQNTVVGICATILNIRTDHQVAVCEVGISLQGEMAERIEILRPTIAAITNVGSAHAQGLGGEQGVAFEKRQIFKFLQPHNIGIINGDQQLLADANYSHPIAKTGFKNKNQVYARKVTSSIASDGSLVMHFVMKWFGQEAQVRLTHGHLGYVANALTASAIGYFLNVSLPDIVRGLECYRGCDERFQLYPIKGGRGRLLSDCYNANPESMRAAIDAFGKMVGPGKKVAVIGDMLELGDKEVLLNRQVGRMLAKAGDIESVILVGSLIAGASTNLPAGTKVMLAPTWVEAAEMLEKSIGNEAFVLVKGSRGVGLKNLVEKFI